MAIAAPTAWIFLVATLPVALWVAWSDMARMKIPNRAVLALVGIFVLLGLVALPIDAYLWRYAHAAAALVLGFVLNQARAMGAGDAKFIAAAIPFVDPADAVPVAQLFAAVLLAAFATHRAARALPPLRAAVPHWKSWTHAKFPMGLALSGTLTLYLLLGATV